MLVQLLLLKMVVLIFFLLRRVATVLFWISDSLTAWGLELLYGFIHNFHPLLLPI
jgi:hypothetical protein